MEKPKNNIEIICPALGRSGTTSLEVALEMLGFGPVYSYFNMIKDVALFREWVEVFANNDPRDPLLGHVMNFRVVSDLPVCVYSPYLIEKNPQAKVILALRDEEDWSRSVVKLYHLSSELDVVLGTKVSNRLWNIRDVINRHVWPVIFEGGEMGDPETAIRNYRKHNAKIREITLPGHLLEYNVKEGWEPLCRFLGITEIPGENFPFVNKGMHKIKYTALQLAFRNMKNAFTPVRGEHGQEKKFSLAAIW